MSALGTLLVMFSTLHHYAPGLKDRRPTSDRRLVLPRLRAWSARTRHHAKTLGPRSGQGILIWQQGPTGLRSSSVKAAAAAELTAARCAFGLQWVLFSALDFHWIPLAVDLHTAPIEPRHSSGEHRPTEGQLPLSVSP